MSSNIINTQVAMKHRGPYHKFADQTPEETTNAYKQVRHVLIDNRVVFMMSGIAIHACMKVLKTSTAAKEMIRRRRLKRIGDDTSSNSNSENPEEHSDTDAAATAATAAAAAASTTTTTTTTTEEQEGPSVIEARNFANECVARVVGILLDQYATRVELRYQDIISQTLLDSVELASYMMARSDTRSAGVDILLHVLDSTKHYYMGSVDTNYYNMRTSTVGLKHVLDSCTRMACRQGIFETFAMALMAERPASAAATTTTTTTTTITTTTTLNTEEGGTEENKTGDDFSWWRGATQLASLFQMIHDVGRSNDSKLLKSGLLSSLVLWGTESFLSLSDAILKKEDTDAVYLMLRNCEAASKLFEKQIVLSDAGERKMTETTKTNDSSSSSDYDDDDDKLPSFYHYRFWLQVTTKYMKTGGLPQRLFSLDQIGPLDRRAQASEPSPRTLQIHGAGNEKVDGVYVLSGSHKSADKWYCRKNDLTIFRCSMQRSGEHHWFISKADKTSPGTDKDIDYYTCKEGPLLPPATGWLPCSKSPQPGPIVLKLDEGANAVAANAASASQGKDSENDMPNARKSQLLMSWIRRSRLLEDELLGDRIHKQLLARAQPLLTTMARNQALTQEDLALLWKRGRDLHGANEEELSQAIFTLLGSTVQHHTPALLQGMLTMINADVFPKTGMITMIPYNACSTFASMLSGSVRMMTSKGKEPTKTFVKLIWGLLSINNVVNAGSSSSNTIDGSIGVTALIATAGKVELTKRLIRPNESLCDLLKSALKASSVVGDAFRKAYVGSCLKMGLDRSIEDTGNDVDEVQTDARESNYIRLLTLIKVLIESHNRLDSQSTELHRMNDNLQFINRYIEEFVAFLNRTPWIEELEKEQEQENNSGSSVSSGNIINSNGTTATNIPARRLWRQCLIAQRLQVLRSLMGKRRGPRLNSDQVRALYSALNKSQGDRDLFASWFAKAATRDGDRVNCVALPVVRDVFQNVVFVGSSPSSVMSMSGWKCFRTLFTMLNEDSMKTTLKAKKNTGGRTLRDESTLDSMWATSSTDTKTKDHNLTQREVVGLEALWDIVLNVADDRISDQASVTLLNVCSRSINGRSNNGVGKDVEEFLEKIFAKHLGGGGDGGNTVTLRCLSLLSKFVKSSRETIAVEREKQRRLQKTIPSTQQWTFDRSPTSGARRGRSALPDTSISSEDQSDGDTPTSSSHGKSSRGSDITITVHGKYILRSASKPTPGGVMTTWNQPMVSSKTTALDSTPLRVHTNMTLVDFRRLVCVTFQLPTNAWKETTFRLSVPRLNSPISDHQNHNHWTLGDLGSYDGLTLKLMYLNTEKQSELATNAHTTADSPISSPTAFANPAASLSSAQEVAFSFGDFDVVSKDQKEDNENDGGALIGLKAKQIKHPSVTLDAQVIAASGEVEEVEEVEEEVVKRPARTPGEYIAQSNKYSSILFDILAKAENESNDEMSKTAWSLLMEIPSVSEKRKQVHVGMSNDVEWERAMKSGSDLHSVYIFQLIDMLLSPAAVPMENEGNRSSSSTHHVSNQWADRFNKTGGFKAVCHFISSGLEEGKMPRQGWKALLRILRVCLSRDPSLVGESVNLSGPLINIVLDSNTNNSIDDDDAEVSVKAGSDGDSDEDSRGSDMVDATLDALSVLKLLLSSTQVSNVAVVDITKNDVSLARLLGDVQLEHASWRVRDATSSFVRALASAGQCEFMLFRIMFAHIMRRVPKFGCATYFTVLEDLIPSFVTGVEGRSSADVVADPLTTINVVDRLIDALAVCRERSSTGTTTIERSMVAETGGSSYLIGTLKLLATVIEHDSTLLLQHNLLSKGGFVKDVYYDFLYSVPTLNNKDAWPLCREKKEREAAFRVLYQLTKRRKDEETSNKNENKNNDDLVSLVESFRATVSLDKVGWRLMPTPTKRSTRFAGLRNQGCTCYQNATLQQLYLIKDIRNGVLNAPLSPLLANNERVLLDFSPMEPGNAPVFLMSPETKVSTTINKSNVQGNDGNDDDLPLATTVIASETKIDYNDPMNLVKKKVDIQWQSGEWYRGTIKMYDPTTGKYMVLYDDGEFVDLDPLKGRPTKEKPKTMSLIRSEMTDQEAAQNVLEQTRRVFRFLQDSQRTAYDPKPFVESCHALKMEFGPYQQNDSSEFLQLLLDRIEVGMTSNPIVKSDHTKWMSLIKGETVKMMNYDCSDFGNHSKVRASETCFVQLRVTGGMKNVGRALEEYTAPEVMEGDNKCECETCKNLMEERGMKEELEAKAYKRRTELRDCFSRLPNILVISLRRFELDFETFETVKRNDVMEFPQILNIETYTHEHFQRIQAEKEARLQQSGNNNSSNDDEAAAAATSSASTTASAGAGEETKGSEETKGNAPPPAAPAPAAVTKDRGDPKYDYQLCGVVIHAGVAGGGHYWSLGRTTEDVLTPAQLSSAEGTGNADRNTEGGNSQKKVDDAKWYKFDDDRVTPFREVDLPHECYGGTEKVIPASTSNYYNSNNTPVERDRSTNAVMIFYERVHRTPYKEDTDDKVVEEEAEQGNEGKQKQTRDGGDTTNVDLSEIEVWDDNEKHVRIQHLFDVNYARFLLRALKEKAPTGASDSFDSSLSRLLSSCVEHYLDVVLHSSDESQWQEWRDALRFRLSQNLSTSIWFLRQLTQEQEGKTWLSDYVLRCPMVSARAAFNALVVSAVKTVATSCEKHPVRQTLVHQAIDSILDLVLICHKHWQASFTNLFSMLGAMLETIPSIIPYVRSTNATSMIINLYLNVRSPEQLKKRYGAIPYMGTQYISPDYKPMALVIATLAGVKTQKPALIIEEHLGSEVVVRLTVRAEAAFRYIFQIGTKYRTNTDGTPTIMTRKEFYAYCSRCNAREIKESNDANSSHIDKILEKYGLPGSISSNSSSGLTPLRQSSMDSVASLSDSVDSLDIYGISPPSTPEHNQNKTKNNNNKKGDIEALSIDGFLQFYVDACLEDLTMTSAWNDLSAHKINHDLSFPGSSSISSHNSVEAEEQKQEENVAVVMPELCQSALESQEYLTRVIETTEIWLSSALLSVIVHKNNSLILKSLISVLVELSHAHERYPANGLGVSAKKTAAFVNKCLSILAPLFGGLQDENQENQEEQNTLDQQYLAARGDAATCMDLAEAFLFGFHADMQRTLHFDVNNQDYTKDGILGVAKVFAVSTYKIIHQQSLNNNAHHQHHQANEQLNLLARHSKTTSLIISLVLALYAKIPGIRCAMASTRNRVKRETSTLIDLGQANGWNVSDDEQPVTCVEEEQARQQMVELEKRYRWAWTLDWLKDFSLHRFLNGNQHLKIRRADLMTAIDTLATLHTTFDRDMYGIFFDADQNSAHGSSSLNNSLNSSLNESMENDGHPSLCDHMCDGNTTFEVNGAGYVHVNGLYRPDGFFDSVPKWVMEKEIPIGGVDSKKTKVVKYTIFRVDMTQRKPRNWYLSEMDEEKPGRFDFRIFALWYIINSNHICTVYLTFLCHHSFSLSLSFFLLSLSLFFFVFLSFPSTSIPHYLSYQTTYYQEQKQMLITTML